MRWGSITLASAAGALALAVPAGANAAVPHGPYHHAAPQRAHHQRLNGPHHNHGLTIAATPREIIAGQGVMIYGQLTGTTQVSGATVRLYHRIAPRRGYRLIGSTTTNAEGFYEFTRAEGVVNTNRSWFVRAPGLSGHVHSTTVFERVAAEVSLNATTTTADTSTPIVFSGRVVPNHAGARVALQVQRNAPHSGWRTIASARLHRASTYTIRHRFRTPGQRDVRVLFRGDARNTAAASDPLTVSIQQAQHADFTIATSAQTITYGGTGAKLSGILYDAGTTTPDAGASVTLWSHVVGRPHWHTVQLPALTGSDGSYSFSVRPAANTVYVVRTTVPGRSTAPLYIGVHDVVTVTPSTTTATVGQRISFTGHVSPDKAHRVAYLERMGTDGHWHIVRVAGITHASNYTLRWTFGHAGTVEFRVRVASDLRTLGGTSAAARITVSAAPAATLPA